MLDLIAVNALLSSLIVLDWMWIQGKADLDVDRGVFWWILISLVFFFFFRVL